MNLALWMQRAGLEDADRPALGRGDRVLRRYGETASRVARLAGALRSRLSLQRGDRVAIAARNSPEVLETLYAIWHAGLAAVPINSKLHGAELGYILEHSGARVCFVSAGIDSELAPHAPRSLEHMPVIGSAAYELLLSADPIPVAPCAPDDLAWLFYTSGTTGRSKGAILSHGVLARMSHAYLAEVDPTEPGDALLHAAPMSHGSGLYMMAHVMRRAINVVPESGGFEPEEIFALLRAWPRASMFAAPTMLKRLIDSPANCDPARIRTFIWGGAPMYVEDAMRALDRFGPRLAQIYGQGESPMTITVLAKSDMADREHPRWRERLGSAGRPFACVELLIADEQDRERAPGDAGDILCRGDTVMAGYWRDPEASAQTLRNGWLHTGDVGALDRDGYLVLMDRSKDLIISGGSNVYPREVEEVLLRHPGVREVSVIGRSDREWGEAVIAYVVGDAPAAELDALCLSAIARFKRPKDYVFVPVLPKNNYGKILKTELRAADSARQGQSPPGLDGLRPKT